jgi:hypothetical protein
MNGHLCIWRGNLRETLLEPVQPKADFYSAPRQVALDGYFL